MNNIDFDANCLNACDTPGIGTYPTGTIFWKAGNTLTAADKVLVIQL